MERKGKIGENGEGVEFPRRKGESQTHNDYNTQLVFVKTLFFIAACSVSKGRAMGHLGGSVG